jgi:hypothetical protein
MKKLSSPIDLIKKSFEIYFKKENAIYFLKIYSLLLPFSIVSMVLGNFVSSHTQGITSEVDAVRIFASFGWAMALMVIINLASIVVYFWVNASGIIGVSNIISGGKLTVREVLNLAWKKLWKLALLGIVAGLITVLGFLLLIVPGVLFVVWFSFASYILIIEGLGVKASMQQSKELVKGRFWPVLGRLFVFGIFADLLQSFLSFIPFVGSFIAALLGALYILPNYLLYKELKG